MDEMIFLPCRIHEEDVAVSIPDNHGYQHLSLPLLVDEPDEASIEIDRKSVNDWFCSIWMTRLGAEATPMIITSRIYEEGEGKNE